MECSKIKKLIFHYLDQELDVKENLAVEEHVMQCEECSAFLKDRQRFLVALQCAPIQEDVPFGLETRIKARLDDLEKESGLKSWGWRWLAPTVTVLSVCIVTFFLFFKEGEELPYFVRYSVESHKQQISGTLPLEIVSSDPFEVGAWFRERIEKMPYLPRFTDKNLQLVGGRLVNYDNTLLASIRYLYKGKDITLLIAPQNKKTSVAHSNNVTIGHQKINIASHNGLNALSWSNNNKNFALVSDLDREGRQSCVVCHASGSGLPDLSAFYRPTKT